MARRRSLERSKYSDAAGAVAARRPGDDARPKPVVPDAWNPVEKRRGK